MQVLLVEEVVVCCERGRRAAVGRHALSPPSSLSRPTEIFTRAISWHEFRMTGDKKVVQERGEKLMLKIVVKEEEEEEEEKEVNCWC